MKYIQIMKYCLITTLFMGCLDSNAHTFLFENCFVKAIGRDTKQPDNIRDTIVLDYIFRDTAGTPVRISDFRGKFVFVDLWYSGCGFCIDANKALRTVHKSLKNENIVFVSISIDSSKEKWMASITPNALPSKLNPWAGKYYPAPGTVILYTGGTGLNNDFIKKYDPDNYYPRLLFIDPTGRLISSQPPRPDNNPEKLTAFIMGYINKK